MSEALGITLSRRSFCRRVGLGAFGIALGGCAASGGTRVRGRARYAGLRFDAYASALFAGVGAPVDGDAVPDGRRLLRGAVLLASALLRSADDGDAIFDRKRIGIGAHVPISRRARAGPVGAGSMLGVEEKQACRHAGHGQQEEDPLRTHDSWTPGESQFRHGCRLRWATR